MTEYDFLGELSFISKGLHVSVLNLISLSSRRNNRDLKVVSRSRRCPVFGV